MRRLSGSSSTIRTVGFCLNTVSVPRSWALVFARAVARGCGVRWPPLRRQLFFHSRYGPPPVIRLAVKSYAGGRGGGRARERGRVEAEGEAEADVGGIEGPE